MLAFTTGLSAGPLFTVDPRLNRPTVRGLSNFSDADGNKVQVSKDFLSRPHLFYFAVTATSEASVDMGILSEVTLCKQDLVGDEVKITRALATPGGEVGEEVASYKAKPVGDKIEIDLTTNMGIRLAGGAYKADAPIKTQDVDIKPDRMAWTQVFELKNPDAQGDAPKSVTLGLRFFCIERSNPGYQTRQYPSADRHKFGFFSVNLFAGGGPGDAATAGDFLLRRDLKKKIVYTLHPNVPQQYRAAVTRGILSWNAVFKQIAGVEPVSVVQGTDPNVVPGDPDTNLVYWFPSSVPKMYLGQAHPMGDPRTGEVFASYILFSQEEIESAVETTDIGTAVDGNDGPPPSRAAISLGNGKGLSLVSQRENLLARMPRADLVADGAPASTAAVLEKIMNWTVPHECGHSLGLRHNFKSTTDLKNIAQGQYCATVMEYLPPMQAPAVPQGYDYAAIAYGYDGKTPAQFAGKNFAYGTDEDQGVDPDTNTYDLGEPYAYLTDHFKHIRRAKDTLTQNGNPGLYLGLLGSAVTPLPKFLGVPSDPRAQKAVDFLAGVLADQGQVAAQAGGNGGQPVLTPDKDLMYTKNLFERVAVMKAIQKLDRRVQADPTMANKLATLLAATVADTKHTDVFTARAVAITSLVGLGKPGLIALVGAAKQIVAFGQANPQAPTIKQEAALLQIIKKLLTPPSQGQPGNGNGQIKGELADLNLSVDLAARPGANLH